MYARPWLSQYPGIYFDYDSPRADHPDLQVHPLIGRQARFSEPFASAVHGVCSKKELADRGLDLTQAFDQIPLQKIVETMRSLDPFKESSIRR